ncbi:MAG: UDP-galactopyranose mutase [Spirochaetota bacterium]
MQTYNLIVGAGISGATIAREIAEQLKERVVVVDKRNHIGGNCYDFINEAGLLVPLYGPHFFHTQIDRVWEYVNRFSHWNDYQHRVLSKVDDKLVPIPVNITTVNTIFGENIENEDEMKAWLDANTEDIPEPKNSEETALNRVGRVLYEKMFRNYTRKQWEMDPSEMDPLVMSRIPVRTNFEDRYFTDPHQGMPAEGYTKLFERLLDHELIEVRLETDYFQARNELPEPARTFFTGRIDQFFQGQVNESLQYRSLRFGFETHDTEFYQSACTVNYPDESVPFTRITEPKHATYEKNPRTTIVKEFPTATGEPYYPVFDPRNKEIFAKYHALAEEAETKGTYFVGRLAQYKYFNMDQAFDNALTVFEKINA